MKRAVESFGDDEIRLRLVEEQDLQTLVDWRNREDARIWFKNSDKLTRDGHWAWYKRYCAKEDDYFFIIEAGGARVGQCAIYDVDRDDGSAEIGRFLVAPDQGGKGYITRGCTHLVRFATSTLALRYLFLEVMEGNARAISVYARCGFVEEGRSGGLMRMGFQRHNA